MYDFVASLLLGLIIGAVAMCIFIQKGQPSNYSPVMIEFISGSQVVTQIYVNKGDRVLVLQNMRKAEPFEILHFKIIQGGGGGGFGTAGPKVKLKRGGAGEWVGE